MIPPQISSLRQLGKLKSAYPQAHPVIFRNLKQFYQRIPKHSATTSEAQGIFGRYYEKYIATDSVYPILHFMGIMIPAGYYIAYFKGGHYHPRFEFH
jgi:hypothetical protein